MIQLGAIAIEGVGRSADERASGCTWDWVQGAKKNRLSREGWQWEGVGACWRGDREGSRVVVGANGFWNSLTRAQGERLRSRSEGAGPSLCSAVIATRMSPSRRRSPQAARWGQREPRDGDNVDSRGPPGDSRDRVRKEEQKRRPKGRSAQARSHDSPQPRIRVQPKPARASPRARQKGSLETINRREN